MNVFVLSTGRCGSMTTYKAFSHATNFTAGHETRVRLLYPDRFNYPADHIESDNRLSWMLGGLDKTFGDDACYIWLRRNPEAVARSYAHRIRNPGCILKAYATGVVMQGILRPVRVSRDMVNTINNNIEAFIKHKPLSVTIQLEEWERDFPIAWEYIGAKGDLDAALGEFLIKHNATELQ